MGKRIIYIIGAGRSGTTLLDIILGNADEIFSAGELNRFTKRNGIPHSARDEQVISFWKQVNNLLSENGFSDPENYYKLSRQFEYHSAFQHFFFHNKEKFKYYKLYQQTLFSAIAEITEKKYNKNIIIDSSKYPLRAYFLSKIFGRNISFIYIQRNPISVVESFQRKDIEQPSKKRYTAHTYLFGVNTLSLTILKRIKKNHNISFVNYERLLIEPLKELGKIESDLCIDLSVPKKNIEENLPLHVGYLFDGNRLRLENSIIFRKTSALHSSSKGINYIFEKLHKIAWYK